MAEIFNFFTFGKERKKKVKNKLQMFQNLRFGNLKKKRKKLQEV